MAKVEPLPVDLLFRRCDPEQLDFESTDELDALEEIIGQERALEALAFGIEMRSPGYNLFALGPSGVGKHRLVREYLGRASQDQGAADDWCYVHNFEQPAHPKALRLPPGRAVHFREDMARLVADMGDAINAARQSDEVRARQQAIDEDFQRRQDEAFEQVQQHAREHDIALIRTPAGVVMAPLQDEDVIAPAQFHELPEAEREQFEAHLQELHQELEATLVNMPLWERERRQGTRLLNQQVAEHAIERLVRAARARYTDVPDALGYLDAVCEDVVQNGGEYLGAPAEDPDELRPDQLLDASLQRSSIEPQAVVRYGVNVLIDHDAEQSAPIVHEQYPTLENLVGRIDHQARLGALTTDFTLIRPGALHRANGGYLILDVRKVLMQPLAWEQLKRALQAGEIRIESASQILSVISTVSLEPEPIPLELKVVLIGERALYYLLSAHDPDFDELFKVAVDFEDRMDRSAKSQPLYARLIATLAREEALLPLGREAVARVIEHGARMVDDSEKLTTHREHVTDVLREAHHHAQKMGAARIEAAHVDAALAGQLRRHGRLRDLVIEEIERGTFLVDTSGTRIGQINGLSVVPVGPHGFGRPSRITASVRLGKGEVLDIEREVELGGPLHSKGVLILAGFLASRFARDFPLSLRASLVFEQSYGGVDGDSASMAEACALLSALADAPISQELAITGAIDQLGQAQPIGGVNEKIEGFFDVCERRGLTGKQGVIIPDANVKHLMLDKRVVDAARQNAFHIYSVKTVDEAVTLLTGIAAGHRDRRGKFAEGTLYERVEARLAELAERGRKYHS
ncbi:MAG: AAA family ATPase [Bradymonadaceae bacterium]|nr:AAA family ATPase [Lujinxingiaceae bacterium]